MQALQVAAAVGQILTGFGTLVLLYIAAVTTVRSKRADILMECHRRFSELQVRKGQTTQKADAEKFFQSFWSSQFDQFGYWQQGFIDDTTFKYWMDSRQREFLQTSLEVCGTPYLTGWHDVRGTWAGTDFIDFVNLIETRDPRTAMDQFRPRGFQKWILRKLAGN